MTDDAEYKDATKAEGRWNLGVGRFAGMIPAANARAYAASVCASMSRGHGVMAERASHLIDALRGADVQHVGHTNALNGADRIVGGILMQTKYCSSGSRCISSCFDKGTFRYMTNGGPMQIEVPKDLHKDAVKAMEVRISRGEVPGVSDKSQASSIVRKGHLTYEQAVNLGKAGTVESVSYDAATGSVIAGYAFGLSAAARFAMGLWRGEDLSEAAIAAMRTGVEIGGLALVTSIATNQLARTALDHAMMPVSTGLVEAMGPEMVKTLAAAFGREGLRGAAANSFVGRILRGNLVGAVASTGVMTGVDAWKVATGRLTIGAAGKGMAVRSASTLAGSAGWVAGSAHGALIGSVVPVLGTGAGAVVGGVLGSISAGGLAGEAAKRAIDLATTSSIDRFRSYVAAALALEIEAHMLTEIEAGLYMDRMYAFRFDEFAPIVMNGPRPIECCREIASPMAAAITAKRAFVSLPDAPEAAGSVMPQAEM